MSFLNSLIKTVIQTASLVGRKAKFTEIIMQVVTTLPALILDAIAFGKLDNAEKLDEALAVADLRLGEEVGAVDILHDLPPDKEEELSDALLKICEILGKNKLKVEGYYTPGTE